LFFVNHDLNEKYTDISHLENDLYLQLGFIMFIKSSIKNKWDNEYVMVIHNIYIQKRRVIRNYSKLQRKQRSF
jgi:hypothetical protein